MTTRNDNITTNFFSNKCNYINSQYLKNEKFSFVKLNIIYNEEKKELYDKFNESDAITDGKAKKALREFSGDELKEQLFILFYSKKILNDKTLFSKTKEYFKTCFAQEQYDKCEWICLHSLNTIKLNVFKTEYINLFPKLIQLWINKNNYKKTYDIFVGDERRIIGDTINKFQGFKFKVVDMKHFTQDVRQKAKWLLDHFYKDFLASNNIKQHEWLQDWTGNLVKGIHTQVMIILQNVAEGIGKSTFKLFLTKLLGNKICYDGQEDELVGRAFNANLYGQLLVSYEEITGGTKDNWKQIDKELKKTITEPTMNFHKKGKMGFKGKNISNCISCSNNLHVIKNDQGRRYNILDISTKFWGNDKFFDKIRSIFNNDVVMCYLFNYFRNRKKAYNLQKFPETKSKIRSKFLSLSPLKKFIRQEFLFQKIGIKEPRFKLYKRFKQFCNRNEYNYGKKDNFYRLFGDRLGFDAGSYERNYDNKKYFVVSYKDLLRSAKMLNYDMEDDSSEYIDNSKDNVIENDDDEDNDVLTFQFAEENQKLKTELNEKDIIIKQLLNYYPKAKREKLIEELKLNI